MYESKIKSEAMDRLFAAVARLEMKRNAIASLKIFAL